MASDFLASLVGGFLGAFLSLPAIITLSVLGVWTEHIDSAWGGFWFILASVAAIFFFQVPFAYVLWSIPVYLAVGFVWSFQRYRRYVRERLQTTPKSSMKTIVADLNPKNQVSSITYWVLFWPFSLLANILSDFIDLIGDLIKGTFRKVYESILASAVKERESQIKPPEPDSSEVSPS